MTQKTDDQPKTLRSRPPTIGPTMNPTPAIAAHVPMADGRSSSGVASTKIDNVSDDISAPPTPCTARKAISSTSTVDSAQAAEPTTNMTIPTTKHRRRPNRSPSAPPSGISAANARAYALTTHSSRPADMCRPCWIDGSATSTIVTSRRIIPWARLIVASVRRDRPFRTGGMPAAAGGRARPAG